MGDSLSGQCLEILKIILTVLQIAIAAIFAYKGLQQWRLQLKLKSLQKTEESLIMICQLADAFIDICMPVPDTPQMVGESHADHRRRDRLAQLKRYKPVLERMTTTSYEAKLYLSDDVLEMVTRMFGDSESMRVKFHMHLHALRKSENFTADQAVDFFEGAYPLGKKEGWKELKDLCQSKMRTLYKKYYAL